MVLNLWSQTPKILQTVSMGSKPETSMLSPGIIFFWNVLTWKLQESTNLKRLGKLPPVSFISLVEDYKYCKTRAALWSTWKCLHAEHSSLENKKPAFHYLGLQYRSAINNRELEDFIFCAISFKKIIRQKKKMKKSHTGIFSEVATSCDLFNVLNVLMR